MSARTLAVLALGASLWGCDKLEVAQDPVWGKQACDHCHMLVSDKRFAAQLVTQAGDRLHFDDVGCLAAYVAERHPQIAHAWVRTAAGSWVDARRAHYATGFQTPMGYGVAAADSGKLDFTAMQRAVAASAPAMRAP